MNITLYTFVTSPYGQKVQAYLAYKQLDYETVYVDPFHPRRQLPIGKIVPVLTIDGESRNDSPEIARWLDQRFGEEDGYPALFPEDAEARETAERVDNWVQTGFIPSLFRMTRPSLGPALPVQLINGWKLGQAVHKTTPGAVGWKRLLWPLVLRIAPFVKREAERADADTVRAAARQAGREFLSHLGDGPFLGELDQPTVADLSAYPQIVNGYQLGLVGAGGLLGRDDVRAWAERVYDHLAAGQPLVPERLVSCSFP